MKRGRAEETITVTGETPVVDVQSTKRETVLSQEVIPTIPAHARGRLAAQRHPGLTVDGNGLAATPTMTFFSARGGQTNEGRMAVNGMTVAAAFNGGGVSSYILDTVNVDEVAVVVSGGLGESDIGGPSMNIVPRSGGNAFRGQAFINNAGEWSNGGNLDDSLRARRASRNRPASSARTTPACRTAVRSSATGCGSSAAIASWTPHDRRGHRRQRQRRQRLAVGTGRRTTASRRASRRAGRCTSARLRRRSPRRTASTSPMSTSCAARARRSRRRRRWLPHPRRRLDCLGQRDHVARSRDRTTSTSRTT